MSSLPSAERLARIKERFNELAPPLLTSGRALIVDDEVPITRLLSVILESVDVPHEIVTDPGRARERLAEPGWDLVLMDYNLPDETGLSLLQHACERHPQAVSFMITAHVSDALADEALAAGAEGYIPKPFAVEEVGALVRRAVARGRFRRQLIGLSEALLEVTEELMQGSGPSTWDPQTAGIVGSVMRYGASLPGPKILVVDEAVRPELFADVEGIAVEGCRFEQLGIKPYDTADLIVFGDAGSAYDPLDRAYEFAAIPNAPPWLVICADRSLGRLIDAVGRGCRGFLTRPIEDPVAFRTRVQSLVTRSGRLRRAMRLGKRVASLGFRPFAEVLAAPPDEES